MKIADIISNINGRVGHGHYKYKDVAGYLDECIDEINEELYVQLPLVSEVYAGSVTVYSDYEIENEISFSENSEENNYTRIPDSYIRNYICYEVAYRKLRDEDEVQEVYAPKYSHARRWFNKLLAEFSNFVLEDVEAIAINGDADEVDGITDPRDDTALGFYNPTYGDGE